MGTWGVKPFSNDFVLNDIGRFSTPKALLKTMKKNLNTEEYYAAYEYTALLSSTYCLGAKQQLILNKIEQINVLQLLDKDILTSNEKDLLSESSEMWLSACSIPVVDRKQMLEICTKELKKVLDNPETGSGFRREKKVLLNYMNNVYKVAIEILNNLDNKPIYISEDRIIRLMKACNYKYFSENDGFDSKEFS